MEHIRLKVLKHPIVSLLIRGVVDSFLVLSVEILSLLVIAILSFVVLSLVFTPIDLDYLKSLVISGVFVIFIFLGVFLFFLTPINLGLGILCGVVLTMLLYFMKLTKNSIKLQKMIAVFLGGTVIGIAGNLNLLIYDYFTSTTSRWNYEDMFSVFIASLSNMKNDPVMGIWVIVMVFALVTLPALLGMKVGVGLVDKLNT